MKKETKQKIAIVVAIVGLMPLMLFGCDPNDDNEQPPQPVSQTKKLTGVVTENGIVDVDINYTALLGHTPSYLSTLETVIRNLLKNRSTNSNLTINVVDGDSNFVLTANRTLSAGKTWLSNSTEQQIGMDLTQIIDSWIAMHNGNDAVRMATAPIPQYNWAMQLGSA